MSIRRSQRLAGRAPDNSTDLSKLISLRNTRRGLLGHLTRVANQVLSYLNDDDTSGASTLHNTLVETFLKFRAANTEYLTYETDEKRILECTQAETREANRLAEIEAEIRLRARLRAPIPSPDTSLFDVDPSDMPSESVPNVRHDNTSRIRSSIGSEAQSYGSDILSSNSDVHSPANSQSGQRSPSHVRFLPKPPSVSSVTAKPRSSFRRLRQRTLPDPNDLFFFFFFFFFIRIKHM